MLTECLFAVCMLAVVIVGLLVMTQVIMLEELAGAIWRGSLAVVLVILAVGLAKAVLLPILVTWVVGLKQTMRWLVIMVLAVIAAMLLLRMLISRLEQWLLARRSHDEGEL